MSGRNLRAIAETKARRSGYPARFEQFVDSLDVDDRAEVDELLYGEPRLSNQVVAATIMDAFGDHPHIVRRPVTENEVLRWRAKHET